MKERLFFGVFLLQNLIRNGTERYRNASHKFQCNISEEIIPTFVNNEITPWLYKKPHKMV